MCPRLIQKLQAKSLAETSGLFGVLGFRLAEACELVGPVVGYYWQQSGRTSRILPFLALSKLAQQGCHVCMQRCLQPQWAIAQEGC